MDWRAVVAAALCAATLASCSSRKTVETNQGTTTIETNALHNTMKVSSGQGVALIGRGAVDPADLGLPLYPNILRRRTGASLSHSPRETTHQVSLVTKDSFEDVYAWYRRHMPAGSEQTHMDAPGGSVASFLIGRLSDKDQKSVLIQETQDATTIMLTHTVAKH